MAVTITRSVWIDDDGTGTTGTVINQALHTTLYNEIDTALAKVAQLAGGNTFTGQQSLATLVVTGAVAFGNGGFNVGGGLVSVSANGATTQGIGIQNTNVANTNMYFAMFFAGNSVFAGAVQQTGTNTVAYLTTSDARLKRDAGRAADLSALRAVVVHEFTWTADGRPDRGIFAQEAHALYPRAVRAGTDDTTEHGDLARPWMTDYSKFVPDLIVGWQQHDAEIADLRAALAAVKG